MESDAPQASSHGYLPYLQETHRYEKQDIREGIIIVDRRDKQQEAVLSRSIVLPVVADQNGVRVAACHQTNLPGTLCYDFPSGTMEEELLQESENISAMPSTSTKRHNLYPPAVSLAKASWISSC